MTRAGRESLTLTAGVLVMALNDHVWKRAYPGFLTGKVSDVAGMIFFPLLLAILLRPLVRRAAGGARWDDGVLAALCLTTAVVFTLTKTTDFGNEAYRVTWGALQWPARAVAAWVAHRPAPGLARVVLVKDPSDVLATPFVLVAYAAARRAPHVLFAQGRFAFARGLFRGRAPA